MVSNSYDAMGVGRARDGRGVVRWSSIAGSIGGPHLLHGIDPEAAMFPGRLAESFFPELHILPDPPENNLQPFPFSRSQTHFWLQEPPTRSSKPSRTPCHRALCSPGAEKPPLFPKTIQTACGDAKKPVKTGSSSISRLLLRRKPL
ncbi:hypothetical protein BHM03_00062914 [Ensete ventricosum]|nr:hypothetical protein BHM03_00062914 [Ensete ventricosum]